jgi:hypothetical protein
VVNFLSKRIIINAIKKASIHTPNELNRHGMIECSSLNSHDWKFSLMIMAPHSEASTKVIASAIGPPMNISESKEFDATNEHFTFVYL